MSARARTRPAVEAKGPAAYIAEAIGTFILVFAICGAVSASAGEGLELNLPALGLLAEAIGTGILMWAIMGMAVNPLAETAFAPLVIGLALGVAAIIFGNATSASLNPARWFGPAIASGELDDFWVYILGPILGACAAALGYRALVLRQRDLPETRPVDVLEQPVPGEPRR